MFDTSLEKRPAVTAADLDAWVDHLSTTAVPHDEVACVDLLRALEQLSSRRPETTTIVLAGRTAPNISSCTAPTASATSGETTYCRVRTTRAPRLNPIEDSYGEPERACCRVTSPP